MPYRQDQRAFFVFAAPDMVAKANGIPLNSDLASFFAGAAVHEFAHTRQLPYVMPQIERLRTRYAFPESIDDNLIQTAFASNEPFRQMREDAGRRISEVLLASDPAVADRAGREALQLIRWRQRQFLQGRYEGWGEMEDVFLTLEGAAMWVQFQHALRAAPDESWLEVIGALSARTDSWSQSDGLGLFLLIARYDPNWPKRFLAKASPPSPLAYLERLLGERAAPQP